jgi:hypothetical protein
MKVAYSATNIAHPDFETPIRPDLPLALAGDRKAGGSLAC